MEKITDFDLMLADRIGVIKDVIAKHGEENFYISFSGGKDSTILHHLIDLAIPNNRIPRVFINTGIEYLDVVKFVRELASKDDRFVIVNAGMPITKTLEKYGYPFKSKVFAHVYSTYQKSGKSKSVRVYLQEEGHNSVFVCNDPLRPLFNETLPFKISDRCCYKLKKDTAHRYEKKSGRNMCITGIRRGEGGERVSVKGCVLTDANGRLKKFHPLLVADNAFEEEFIKRYDVKLCRLYYPPFNFKRTGCKGCPFALDLQSQLDTMKRLLPNEYKQCVLIFGKSYDLYKRCNYRLKGTDL